MMTYRFSRFTRGEYWYGIGSLGRMARFFGPGEVRLALLSLLSERPKHGYELMRQLEQRSGGVYQASAGTVYPTLQQLEDEGLIASETTGGKRVYRLTSEGEGQLRREDEAVSQIWRRAERWREWRCTFDPEAAALRGPAERLVKAAFRAVTGDISRGERIEQVRKILERALDELESLSRS